MKNTRHRLLRTSLRRSPSLGIGLVVLVLIFAACFVGPSTTQADPTSIDYSSILNPPNRQHLLGTDDFGRDVLSRIMSGGQNSIAIGLYASVLSGIVGCTIGLVAGYQERLRAVLMRTMDILMSFPALLLALAILSALGSSSLNVAIALALAYTPRTSRIVESATLQIKSKTYIEADQAIGVPTWRILARGIFPNILAPLIVQQTFVFAYAILGETGLSFVGVGIQPPTASWGNIVGDARSFMREAPWMVFFPGAAIMLLVLSLNLLGDGLREVLDPKRRT